MDIADAEGCSLLALVRAARRKRRADVLKSTKIARALWLVAHLGAERGQLW